ncbi:MAG: TrmH family RNA methyltransferase [Acidobacteriota bacterium]
MALGGLILVEPSLPGNLGAAMRVAANFGVNCIELVRPSVSPDDPDVLNWACGAERFIECRLFERFSQAAKHYHTLVASASARGRQNLPVVSPDEARPLVFQRGIEGVALVFGNETSGLSRDDLDRCDLVVRIPTEGNFPVLNLAQAVAILVSTFRAEGGRDDSTLPQPASQDAVEGLMGHLEQSLLTIGFLDPLSPKRILRQIRRLFGRAGITHSEVSILRGICRQMEWAAGAKPGRFGNDEAEEAG